MKPRLVQAIIGGVAGTILMTLMLYYVAPLMTGGPMDIASMLGEMTGTNPTVGMITHFVLGSLVFPAVFVALWATLPGAPWMKGLVFGLLLALIALVVVLPMAGKGLFFANHPRPAMAVVALLLGHAVYGLLLGWWSGKSVTAPPAATV